MPLDLTEEAIKAVKTPDGVTLTRLQDGDGDGAGNGLFLFVWSDGCKRWKVRRNFNRELSTGDWFMLGEYPDMSLVAAREVSELPIPALVHLKPLMKSVTDAPTETVRERAKKLMDQRVVPGIVDGGPISKPLLLGKLLSIEVVSEYREHILYNTRKAEEHYRNQKYSDYKEYNEFEYYKEREYADTAVAYRKAIENSAIRERALRNFISVLYRVGERTKINESEPVRR